MILTLSRFVVILSMIWNPIHTLAFLIQKMMVKCRRAELFIMVGLCKTYGKRPKSRTGRAFSEYNKTGNAKYGVRCQPPTLQNSPVTTTDVTVSICTKRIVVLLTSALMVIGILLRTWHYQYCFIFRERCTVWQFSPLKRKPCGIASLASFLLSLEIISTKKSLEMSTTKIF